MLGKFKIANLPEKKKGEMKVEVKLEIQDNSILIVTAYQVDNQDNKEQLIIEKLNDFSDIMDNLIEREKKMYFFESKDYNEIKYQIIILEETIKQLKNKKMSKVVKPGNKNAKKAILDYEELDALETDKGVFTYALITLHTGRFHQIRCQMAAHGVPVYGDRKYNKIKSNVKQIGLIATRLEFEHPTTKEHMVFKTEPWGDAFDILDAEEEW